MLEKIPFKLSDVVEALDNRLPDSEMNLEFTGFSALDEAAPGTLTWSRGDVPGDCPALAAICPPSAQGPQRVLRLHDKNPRGAMACVIRAIAGEHTGFGAIAQANFSVVAEDTVIGNFVIIGPNVVIGGDGFGFEQYRGELIKFPHLGKVIIGDNVEIMSGTCIARGSLKDTVIEDDVKIDQLCHIAHNVHIGKGSAIVAGTCLGGSVRLGERVWVGIGVRINDNISVGDGALIGSGAVVLGDVPAKAVMVGNPAREIPRKKHYKFVFNEKKV